MTQEQINQIEKIVERILKDAGIGVPTDDGTKQAEKKSLVIFGATQTPLEQILKQLQTCIQEGWNFTIILSDLATKTVNIDPICSLFAKDDILHENSITDVRSLVESHSQVILPALSYPMAAKLALKLVDTPCTYLIFHALACGKRVLAVSDILSAKTTHSPGVLIDKKTIDLEKIEQGHVNVLTDFGVKWITSDKIAETVQENYILKRISTDIPVISAAVIENMESDVNELIYGKRSIITPLAREHAQKRGIKLTPKS